MMGLIFDLLVEEAPDHALGKYIAWPTSLLLEGWNYLIKVLSYRVPFIGGRFRQHAPRVPHPRGAYEPSSTEGIDDPRQVKSAYVDGKEGSPS